MTIPIHEFPKLEGEFYKVRRVGRWTYEVTIGHALGHRRPMRDDEAPPMVWSVTRTIWGYERAQRLGAKEMKKARRTHEVRSYGE